MVGKPNITNDAERTRSGAGSSSVSYASPLDQERAASMADEGGTAGARIDTLEQEGRIQIQAPDEPSRVRHLIGEVSDRVGSMLKRLLKRSRYRWSRSSD
jgi:hypothetical protein